MHLLWACRLQTSCPPTAFQGCPPCCADGCLWILFHFQDSNPFASLVFYWEPLNRQVSEHSLDSLEWAELGGA